MNLPPRKVAVVDIGSNSTKVLIALVNTNGEVVKVREEGFSCRLIDKGNISSAIISREKRKELLSGLSRLLKICTQEGVSDAILVATEAIRTSLNADELEKDIFENFSKNLFVLSGKKEAELIAQGILLEPQVTGQENFQAFDLGGGSLEIIDFNKNSQIVTKSLRLGALTIKEKFSSNEIKILDEEMAKNINGQISSQLNQTEFRKDSTIPMLGLGGVVYFIRKILSAKNSIKFEEKKEISYDEICELTHESLNKSLLEIINRFPDLPRDRADVFPFACLVIQGLMKRLSKKSFFHSTYNLRYGVASNLGNVVQGLSFLAKRK